MTQWKPRGYYGEELPMYDGRGGHYERIVAQRDRFYQRRLRDRAYWDRLIEGLEDLIDESLYR